MLQRHLLHHGQSQPGAFGFGRKEGQKDFLQIRLGIPAPLSATQIRCHFFPPSSSIVPDIVTRGCSLTPSAACTPLRARFSSAWRSKASSPAGRQTRRRIRRRSPEVFHVALPLLCRRPSASEPSRSKFQGLRETQKFCDDVGQRARLVQDPFRGVTYVSSPHLAANHLRVARNRRQ